MNFNVSISNYAVFSYISIGNCFHRLNKYHCLDEIRSGPSKKKIAVSHLNESSILADQLNREKIGVTYNYLKPQYSYHEKRTHMAYKKIKRCFHFI